MKKTIALAVVTATLLLTAGSAVRADEKMNAVDRQFTMMVSQGNMAEIMTSQLALKKSKNPKVRQIAQMLIDQHGKAQKDLKTVAQLHKFSLPPGTDAKHKAVYRKLSGLSGATFDKAYMMAQVKDHYATVGLFNKELAKGNETHVHSFAAKYLPDIQTHTDMITSLASNLGIPVAAPKMASKGMKM